MDYNSPHVENAERLHIPMLRVFFKNTHVDASSPLTNFTSFENTDVKIPRDFSHPKQSNQHTYKQTNSLLNLSHYRIPGLTGYPVYLMSGSCECLKTKVQARTS